MKYKVIFLTIAAAGILLTGCETPDGSPDRTATGALLGGAIGVASGALLDGHHAGEAALIGGGIGAVTGGLIGHAMDADERARLRAQAPETYARIDTGQPVGIEDVKAMSRSGLSDDVIISQIRNTRTAYRLSATDIIALHDAGVSQNVIDYMINTPSTAGAPPPAPSAPVEVTQAPPTPPTESVVVAPGPGYVWIPGDWEWHGRWVWVGGFWAAPPYAGAVWIHGGWYHGPHGWYHSHGYWRRA